MTNWFANSSKKFHSCNDIWRQNNMQFFDQRCCFKLLTGKIYFAPIFLFQLKLKHFIVFKRLKLDRSLHLYEKMKNALFPLKFLNGLHSRTFWPITGKNIDLLSVIQKHLKVLQTLLSAIWVFRIDLNSKNHHYNLLINASSFNQQAHRLLEDEMT